MKGKFWAEWWRMGKVLDLRLKSTRRRTRFLQNLRNTNLYQLDLMWMMELNVQYGDLREEEKDHNKCTFIYEFWNVMDETLRQVLHKKLTHFPWIFRTSNCDRFRFRWKLFLPILGIGATQYDLIFNNEAQYQILPF